MKATLVIDVGLWAIESMRSHHVETVVFEGEFADLFGAVTKRDVN